MNWCKEHWDYLKQVLEVKGLYRFVGEGAEDGLKGLTGDRFDPLMGSWARINANMLRSPGLHGRIMMCPLCILVADGQPHLAKSWVNGCTDDAIEYAIKEGLMDRQGNVEIPEPPTKAGTQFKRGGIHTEHVCPDCGVERADYEGPNGGWLPKCPNCASTADPVDFSSSIPSSVEVEK